MDGLQPDLVRPTICIVDDASVRTSLMDLFDSLTIDAASYDSADDFLMRADLAKAGCILLETDGTLPIVFMTGRGTVPMRVQAMKAGASDILLKPFDRTEIVDRRIERSAKCREAEGPCRA